MGKSIRSKVKRYWRSQLRQTIGVDNLKKQEAVIQNELQKALKAQEGESIFGLKKMLNKNTTQPVTEENATSTDVDVMDEEDNVEIDSTKVEQPTKKAEKSKPWATKSKSKKRQGKKFVHFHSVRTKGA